MFRRYYEPGDIFASIILFLVIGAFLAILAVYVGAIVLFIFLGVGVLIAFVYACIVYVKSLVSAIKTLPPIRRHGTLINFILKWLWVLKTTSVLALKDNLSIAHSAIIKASSYRLLSFKKWMWLLVAPAVLILGTLLIIGLALVQFEIFFIIALICFFLILCLLSICIISFVPFAFYILFKSFLEGCRTSGIYDFCFSTTATYSQFGVACSAYFKGLGGILKKLWEDCISETKSNIGKASTYAVLNITKYFYLASPIALFLVAIIYSILIAVLGFIAFLALAIANIVWTTIVKIFVH